MSETWTGTLIFYSSHRPVKGATWSQPLRTDIHYHQHMSTSLPGTHNSSIAQPLLTVTSPGIWGLQFGRESHKARYQAAASPRFSHSSKITAHSNPSGISHKARYQVMVSTLFTHRSEITVHSNPNGTSPMIAHG